MRSRTSGLLFLVCVGAGCVSGGDGETPEPLRRIAFGSCAFQWDEQPIWEEVLAVRPDLFVFAGDAIYADFDGRRVVDVDRAHLESQWRALAEKPEFVRLRAEVPVAATWDNHDYGTHDGGAEFELKQVSKELFLDFFGEPANSERRSRPGIFTANVFGPPGRRVQVVLLDTRWWKSAPMLASRPEDASGSLGKYAPDDSPQATLLGPYQWAWLEEQLLVPAELRLIVSSGQVVANEKGMDEWGNYPLERRRLFDLIRSTEAEGVLFLSGNVHFAELSRVSLGTYPLLDFTSSGLTHVEPAYAEAGNTYRIAGPCTDINFGLVEIDWEAHPTPLVRLSARRGDGTVAFLHRISLDDLRAR